MPVTRADLLREASLLEEMGGEWHIGHAAAFCLLSASSLYRSDCPRIWKAGIRGTKGRDAVRFEPKAVRAWNAARTKKETAA